jgi:hypothetical protein
MLAQGSQITTTSISKVSTCMIPEASAPAIETTDQGGRRKNRLAGQCGGFTTTIYVLDIGK